MVHLLDKLALCEDDGGPSMFEICVWQLMPEDLLDRILLFVPASSQARLRCVCKRWSQLVTSSAFRKESELIAYRRGHRIAYRRGHRNFVCCKLELALANEAGNYHGRGGAPYKVDMPGATTSIPGLKINSRSLEVFCGAGLVGVAHMSDEGTLDCWVLNVANRTCRQLPPLFLGSRSLIIDGVRWRPADWQIWLEPAPESSGSSATLGSFHVVLMVFHPCAIDPYESVSPALYTCSSTSTVWRSVHHPIRPCPKWCSCAVTNCKGGYVTWNRSIGDFCCKRVRMSWDSDCITQLPDPPFLVEVISDPGPSTAAVFRWKVDQLTLSLYRLDESLSSGWRCLYSGQLPPQLHPPRRIHQQATKILGNMLILVISIWEYYPQVSREQYSWAMAYHMHDGSCSGSAFLPKLLNFSTRRGIRVCFWNPRLYPTSGSE